MFQLRWILHCIFQLSLLSKVQKEHFLALNSSKLIVLPHHLSSFRGSSGAQHSKYAISILFISPIKIRVLGFQFSTLSLKKGLLKRVLKSNFQLWTHSFTLGRNAWAVLTVTRLNILLLTYSFILVFLGWNPHVSKTTTYSPVWTCWQDSSQILSCFNSRHCLAAYALFHLC